MSRIEPVLARAMELSASGKEAEAVAALEELLRSQPKHAMAHAMLGELFHRSHRLEEALPHIDMALAGDPRLTGLHTRRALVLRDLGRFPEAEAAAQTAVRLEPTNVHAHMTRVSVLYAAGNLIDSADYAQQTLRLKPDAIESAYMAGMALIHTGSAGRAAEVLRSFLKVNPGALKIRDTLNTALTYSAAATPGERTESLVAFARLVTERLHRASPAPLEDPDPERPLRVGYLAQDISERSAIAFFIEQVFACHDRERYPITCYLTQPTMGIMTPHMLGHLRHWVDVGAMDNEATAARIREDKIDILVDLAGATPGNRLPALLLHPAPVIATAIGCPQTTGLSCVGYRMVDAITDPPGSEKHWVERLARLPGCFLCYRPPDDAPPCAPRAR